jgi:ABC-type transport system involved in multi-copper enzyme maturation permease subunit
MNERLLNLLPDWAHPRFPLVANELRQYTDIDFRIKKTSEQLRTLFSALDLVLLISAVLIVIGGGRLFGLFTLPIILFAVPFVFILSEVLFTRLILGAPSQTSQMIAGEIERGTWDIILSTSLPRYQIILSKFVALGWNSEPALVPIIVVRVLFMGLLVVERFVLDMQAFDVVDVFVIGVAGFLVALMPIFELVAFWGVGLLISAVASSPWNANVLIRSTWVVYRAFTAVIFMLLYVGYSAGELEITYILLPLMIVPQWGQILIWLILPTAAAGSSELGAYGAAFGGIYIVLPLCMGILALLATTRFVLQNQR